jgi:hypothetical protein
MILRPTALMLRSVDDTLTGDIRSSSDGVLSPIAEASIRDGYVSNSDVGASTGIGPGQLAEALWNLDGDVAAPHSFRV